MLLTGTSAALLSCPSFSSSLSSSCVLFHSFREFEGVEPCPICYSTLHPKTMALPSLQCHTCNNKFHSPCLFTWFKVRQSDNFVQGHLLPYLELLSTISTIYYLPFSYSGTYYCHFPSLSDVFLSFQMVLFLIRHCSHLGRANASFASSHSSNRLASLLVFRSQIEGHERAKARQLTLPFPDMLT